MNLPSELLIVIFGYLTLSELCNCETVCASWRQVLFSSNASVLYFQLDLQRKNLELAMSWLTSKLKLHRPKHLNLSGCSLTQPSLKSVLVACKGYLKSLDISFFSLPLDFYSKLSLTALKSIRINDAHLKDENLEKLLTLPSLKKLNVNYNSSLKGRPFKVTSTALKALWFEGCEHIEYNYIYSYLENFGLGLEELGIDGEYFNSFEVCNLLSLAPHLIKFSIEYANEMDCSIGEHLEHRPWKYFKIRRALSIPQSTFSMIFKHSLEELNYLNLAECTFIDDRICLLIADSCRNIRSFVLTWCTEVSDCGISCIIANCNRLNFLDLTGLKEITDLCFPLVELPIYRHLDFIILEKCNKISDSHLWNLSNMYSRIKIKNYYGEFREGWTGSIFQYPKLQEENMINNKIY